MDGGFTDEICGERARAFVRGRRCRWAAPRRRQGVFRGIHSYRIIRIRVWRLHSDIPENCCVVLMLRRSQRRGRTKGEVGGGRVCRGVSPLV